MKKNEPDGEAVKQTNSDHGGGTKAGNRTPKHKGRSGACKGMANENLVPKQTSRKEQI